MLINNVHLAEINSPNQKIRARVELYKGSTLEKICNCGDILQDFTLGRVGEGKFFGYGVCQSLKANLIDMDREINITKENTIEASFGVNSDFIYPFPVFYVEDVSRDETDNSITVTAYDALYKAVNHKVEELVLPEGYTIGTFAIACATLLGLPVNLDSVTDDSFNLYFPGGANFDGTESIREALNRVAEATQTIYYINSKWELAFVRLNEQQEPVISIDKNGYIELKTTGAQVLGGIVHVTELGDNVAPAAPLEGATQYVRDNPFWDLREDIAELVEGAQAALAGISIEQFESIWIGNYLVELGDKIEIEQENGNKIISYILDDTITFDGALMQETRWSYDNNDAETESNPTSIGAIINQTTARVDKVNKQIELVVSETGANRDAISELRLNTNSISASVKEVEKDTDSALDEMSEAIATLTHEVSAKVDATGVQIAIKQEIANGVEKVKTSTTGYTFDDNGLNISKSDSEISTTITENGMRIDKLGEEVLTADSSGVKAEDLHATTFLIIGKYSRLENYEADGGNRTGCFWIGG